MRKSDVLSASKLVFDQLILESSRGICHLSFAPSLRREVLTVTAGLPKSIKMASRK
jgi:hypothetical protein